MTIYQITNTVNGKIYIGKTIKTIEHRFKEHILVSHRETATRSNTLLSRAIRKYGTEAFTIAEVESGFNSEDDLNEAEIRYIAELKPQYNMTEGGEGISGYKHSSETRRKISESLRDREFSDEHKRKISIANSNPKTGRALAACLTNLEKATQSNIGRKHSKETIEKRKSSRKKYWDSLSEKEKKRPWLYRKVVIDGKVIESVQKAASMYKVSKPTVHNRIKSNKFDWKYYE